MPLPLRRCYYAAFLSAMLRHFLMLSFFSFRCDERYALALTLSSSLRHYADAA